MIQSEYAGLDAYLTYMAVKMHFSKNNYDYFKYNGKTTTKPESFLKRKDKFFFEKIERKYKDEELVKYFVANFLDDPKGWSGTIASNKGSETYTEWKKSISGLSYHLRTQFTMLSEYGNDIYVSDNGNHPLLLKMFMRNQVSIETLICINVIMKFFGYWNTQMEFDPIWEDTYAKIKAYRPFFKQYAMIDKQKIMELYQKFFLDNLQK